MDLRAPVIGSSGSSWQKGISVKRFLNRILGLEVERQQKLFKYFSALFDVTRRTMIKEGRVDRAVYQLKGDISFLSRKPFPTPETASGTLSLNCMV